MLNVLRNLQLLLDLGRSAAILPSCRYNSWTAGILARLGVASLRSRKLPPSLFPSKLTTDLLRATTVEAGLMHRERLLCDGATHPAVLRDIRSPNDQLSTLACLSCCFPRKFCVLHLSGIVHVPPSSVVDHPC
jgi:hypothetical protein